ncbi:MAG: hypothetical protein U5K30_04450 [Acidimicrobiales bacterium]|nr:hypothetical protein [Acidimicrobiales bacterium]
MSTDRTERDEHRHEPGTELWWAESWSFDFAAGDGSLGGWARFTLVPNQHHARYEAFLTGPDRQLVAVTDGDIPMPGSGLEIRTEGLWAMHICETAFDHWTIGLEAFAVGLDDPAEMYGRQFGDQVPLGFDLEWEAEQSADDVSRARTAGYQQACKVTGEVLVGSEEIDLDGTGFRDHRWGVAPDWDARWLEVRGRLDGGPWFSAMVIDGDINTARGTLDGRAVPVGHASQSIESPGLLTGAHVRLGGVELGFDPVGGTPLELTDPEGRRTRNARALCRVTAADGRSGHAWVNWNEPQID